MVVNVVLFTSAFDTGGQGWRIKHAFDRYQPDFSVRSIHTFETYFDYPHDLRHMVGAEHSFGLTEAADVLHMRNSLAGLKRLRASERPVGLILHHHGTRFREDHVSIAAEARSRGAIQLVSTIDLTLLEPDVEWLPSPFDIGELSALRTLANAKRVPGPIRIAHSPTNRTVKSTNLVLEAVQKLFKGGLNVVLDLIERRTHAETLIRKTKADILIDQLHLGYGNSAVEAWCMGIPVIAGIVDQTARSAMLERWGRLPFYEATPDDLAERLAELVTDSDLRSHWGKIGQDHAWQFHDDLKVSDLLAKYYHKAMAVVEEKVS